MGKALLALALVAAFATAAGGAGANGSPYSPGLVEGWDGVLAQTGDIRYVTLTTPSATIVAAIRIPGGRVESTRVIKGFFGVPIVAYDG